MLQGAGLRDAPSGAEVSSTDHPLAEANLRSARNTQPSPSANARSCLCRHLHPPLPLLLEILRAPPSARGRARVRAASRSWLRSRAGPHAAQGKHRQVITTAEVWKYRTGGRGGGVGAGTQGSHIGVHGGRPCCWCATGCSHLFGHDSDMT